MLMLIQLMDGMLRVAILIRNSGWKLIVTQAIKLFCFVTPPVILHRAIRDRAKVQLGAIEMLTIRIARSVNRCFSFLFQQYRRPLGGSLA